MFISLCLLTYRMTSTSNFSKEFINLLGILFSSIGFSFTEISFTGYQFFLCCCSRMCSKQLSSQEGKTFSYLIEQVRPSLYVFPYFVFFMLFHFWCPMVCRSRCMLELGFKPLSWQKDVLKISALYYINSPSKLGFSISACSPVLSAFF